MVRQGGGRIALDKRALEGYFPALFTFCPVDAGKRSVAMARVMVLLGLVAVGGCFSPSGQDGDRVSLVSNNPFGLEAPAAATTHASYTQASQEISLRVDKLGKDLIEANKEIGVRPLFGTIGSEKAEVFHVGTRIVYVTSGLVNRCSSSAELAAVLALELGKMVAEREAHTSPEVRSPEQRPPIRLPVGNGVGPGQPDLTAVAELGRFESANPKTLRPTPRPDPQKLARAYLEKAGYQAADLETAAPVLHEAEKNIGLENQFKGTLPQSPSAP